MRNQCKSWMSWKQNGFLRVFHRVGIFVVFRKRSKRGLRDESTRLICGLSQTLDKTKNFPQKLNAQPGDGQKAEFMVCDRSVISQDKEK